MATHILIPDENPEADQPVADVSVAEHPVADHPVAEPPAADRRARAHSVAPWSAAGDRNGHIATASQCYHCARPFAAPLDTDRALIDSPEAAGKQVVPLLARADREHCVVLLLDTKHRLLEAATVSVGSIDHTFMSPREVFRDALFANAAAVVLAHNHPSGDAQPSRDDVLVTRRIQKAGQLVGVDVLDHLVVGGERWVSIARTESL